MHIRTTINPISLVDILDPEHHPCLHEGNDVNGLEIYFENEEDIKIYMTMELEDKKY